MQADVFRAWIAAAARVIEEQRDHLTQLDAAIGDADHGINLSRGFTAVLSALESAAPATPGAVLTLTGIDADLQGRRRLRPAVRDGLPRRRQGAWRHRRRRPARPGGRPRSGPGRECSSLGAAREGDKTMVDALAPATGAFSKAVAEGASRRRRSRRARRGRPGGGDGHHPDAGAQGTGQLPRAAQRRARRSRGSLDRPDPRRPPRCRAGGPMTQPSRYRGLPVSEGIAAGQLYSRHTPRAGAPVPGDPRARWLTPSPPWHGNDPRSRSNCGKAGAARRRTSSPSAR